MKITPTVNTTADIHNPTSANPPTNTNISIIPARASSGINALPPELLKNLRGIGSHASRIPTFDNNQKNFNNWIRALNHFLLINGSYDHLQATTISAADNLALYMLIATCLSGSSLELVQTQAFQDGQKAFKLLKQKYQGSFYAREGNAMFALATLQQSEAEDLAAYIARCESTITDITEFKTIRNSNFYTTMALRGIHSKYKILKTILNSEKIPDWATFKEKVESHAAMTQFDKTSNQIMQVSEKQNLPQIIQKRGNKKYAKFLKPKIKCQNCFGSNHTTSECRSEKYCSFCNNASHNEVNCRNKPNFSRGRGARGYNSRAQGSYPRGRGRGANYSAAQTNSPRRPHFLATRGRSLRGRSAAQGRGRINNTTHNTQFHAEDSDAPQSHRNILGSGYAYGNYNNPSDNLENTLQNRNEINGLFF